ncbi:hypothetical protein V2J09_015088 [Rumex salicifolius]
MEELKKMVIKLAIAQNKQQLSSSQIALIDRQLHQEFPIGLRTPNHPTYASMINKAITDLDEKGGSKKTSIYEYIREHFEDLPWGHSNFLSHHLTKLCDEGVIVLNACGRYSIPLLNEEQESRLVSKTSARHRSAELEKHELVEVEVHGSVDEHLTSFCEIEVVILNFGGKKKRRLRSSAR